MRIFGVIGIILFTVALAGIIYPRPPRASDEGEKWGKEHQLIDSAERDIMD